jgi:hypothetical protein
LIGFLPNGDLITVYYDKIYKNSFINKPTSATTWKYSQIYDLEIHKNKYDNGIGYCVNQKLFHFNDGLVTQFDLLTMTIEKQYNLIGNVKIDSQNTTISIVINKYQTLLALYTSVKTDLYSMETGIWISRHG